MRTAALAFLLFSIAPVVTRADSASHYLETIRKAQRRPAAINKAAASSTPCFGNTIVCGETIQGVLDAGCSALGFSASDFFSFDGSTGEAVTVTMSSSDFEPFVDLQEPLDDTGNGASAPGTTSSPAVVSFTLDNTGSWTIGAGNFGFGPASGNYTLSLQCSGGQQGNCASDQSTLCLNGGRFRVTATFDAGNGNSGAAQVISLTDDTGYLWFFNSSNVEAVIKVLNGCGLGGYYWVFAGGLTNVEVTITVTDTLNNVQKVYQNPANTTFQPIQDTSAFATCP